MDWLTLTIAALLWAPTAPPGSPDCVPGFEATGLTVDKQGDGDYQFQWDDVFDPCGDGYYVLGSNDAGSAAGFDVVGVTPVPVWSGSPEETYFLVVIRGLNGEQGPWGHYGR